MKKLKKIGILALTFIMLLSVNTVKASDEIFDNVQYSNHWIIAHGYYASRVDGDYVIVNNGWEQNNVWIAVSGTNFGDMVYFEK